MLAAVLLTTLLLSARAAAGSDSTGGHTDLAQALPLAEDDAKWLYKRRRGGGDSSDSDSDSGSGSSSDYDDDNSDSSSGSSGGGSSSSPPLCYYDKNVTIEMTNTGSFGDYYRAGTGSPGNNTGGYTPEGSGTYPRWDNSSGSWVALRDYDVSYLRSGPEYVYLGGAGVPYTSGETSPNGVEPTRLDLDFVTAPYPYIGGDLCSVPNSSYAYRYAARYNWSELNLDDDSYSPYIVHLMPVYCCCALYTVCGCDDGHRNESFVPVLLESLGIYNDPRNDSGVCSVTVDGELALIVNGTLANGSTMADRDATPTKETVLVKESRVSASSAVLAKVCTVDDVLHSLQALGDDTTLLPNAIWGGYTGDPDMPNQDYDAIVGHLKNDLACEIQIPDQSDQQRVCDAYADYTAEAQSILENARREDESDEQPPIEFEFVRDNLLGYRENMLVYTTTIGAAVPTCAQSINDAYVPLDDELEQYLKLYPN
ncbi:hypothetical protein BJX96DRAFT_174772 [Aspergillus floccosus]